MTIAVLCAAGVGSVGGGLIALQVSPESSSTQPTAPSISNTTPAQPTPPRPAIVAEPITPPDPHVARVAQIQAVLSHVPDWARTHPGAHCPDIGALGVDAIDPWGHRIELTCTDQPADQVMGALSAGPDGIPGSSDDVKSWNLGPSVTQLVQGRRWTPATAAAATTKPASGKRRKDASSTSDHISRIPRTGSAKPASSPRSVTAPTAAASTPTGPGTTPTGPGTVPTTSRPLPSPSTKPSIAPTPPTDAADGIPTRR